MPEISRFYGIIIRMYIKDHAPPHFHADYGDDSGMINIETGELLQGYLPRRALRLVQDWAELHREELFDNFNALSKGKSEWKPITPLN
jgi:hypothetical protein